MNPPPHSVIFVYVCLCECIYVCMCVLVYMNETLIIVRKTNIVLFPLRDLLFRLPPPIFFVCPRQCLDVKERCQCVRHALTLSGSQQGNLVQGTCRKMLLRYYFFRSVCLDWYESVKRCQGVLEPRLMPISVPLPSVRPYSRRVRSWG